MRCLVNPAARAARVRERDDEGSPSDVLDHVLAPDDLAQGKRSEESIDRQAAHGNDESRAEKPKLVVEPARAPGPLRGRRDAIAPAGGMRPGIAPGDRADVEPGSCRVFADARAREPAKQRLPCPSGERLAAMHLGLPRGLAHEKCPRRARERRDRHDARCGPAATAGRKPGAVRVERTRERTLTRHRCVLHG